jgi:hypothetical protein
MNIPNIPQGQWKKLYMPEATCAFGDPYCIHVRRGDPRRLIFWLEGGGVSWDRESAKWPGTAETRDVYRHVPLYSVIADGNPAEDSIRTGAWSGLLSTTEENPLADWSMVMVPYATGDFHTGTADLTFTAADGSERVLHHHGYRNLQKVLELTRQLFPDVDRLLICGESAGAYGVAALSGDVMDAYPDCADVTLLCDSALMSDDWSETVQNIWQAPPHIANALHTENMVADWFESLYRRYGSRPRYLYTCGCRDETLITFRHYIDDGRFISEQAYADAFCDALGVMYRRLKASVPGFTAYVHDFEKERLAPGVKHCIVANGCYTGQSMDGITPMKWLADAMEDRLYDVGIRLIEAEK